MAIVGMSIGTGGLIGAIIGTAHGVIITGGGVRVGGITAGVTGFGIAIYGIHIVTGLGTGIGAGESAFIPIVVGIGIGLIGIMSGLEFSDGGGGIGATLLGSIILRIIGGIVTTIGTIQMKLICRGVDTIRGGMD